jgi:hypothetical protein
LDRIVDSHCGAIIVRVEIVRGDECDAALVMVAVMRGSYTDNSEVASTFILGFGK